MDGEEDVNEGCLDRREKIFEEWKKFSVLEVVSSLSFSCRGMENAFSKCFGELLAFQSFRRL